MEPGVVRTERRGRKRKIKDPTADQPPQKKQSRSKAFVGRYVKKAFEGIGVFLGKIVSYESGLYRVDYEDGDCEDLESGELRLFLIEEDELSDDFLTRKKNLDQSIAKKYGKVGDAVESVLVSDGVGRSSSGGGKLGNGVDSLDVSNRAEKLSNGDKVESAVEVAHVANEFESFNGGVEPEPELTGAQVEEDADSLSDSCESAQDYDLVLADDTPSIPPPELPPSSGNIGVPEEYVSYLFSVYSFLRSFSICLFLTPFGLDEFVGALNCSIPNTLLDAIHVALMRALSQHSEVLPVDGSDPATKCLRSMDWSLLDTLTWPVFLVQYLMITRYTEGPEWKGFYVEALEKDYYTLSAGRKLMVLQILCDEALDSLELRAEVDMREESEVGSDSDAVKVIAPESGPRRVHPRYSKTSACKDQEVKDVISDDHIRKVSSSAKGTGSYNIDVDEDGNGDECRLCGMDGMLLCCDGCPSAYHSRCIGLSKISIPEGAWYCPECTSNKLGPNIATMTSLRGAENFGVDSYGQLFLGSCDHLLVLKALNSSESCFRYYHKNDIKKVLLSLCSSPDYSAIYSEIFKGILQYWEIQEDMLYHIKSVELDKKFPAKKEDGDSSIQCTLQDKGTCNMPLLVDPENAVSGVTESSSEDLVVSSIDNICKKTGLNHISSDKINEFDQTGHQIIEHSFCTENDKHSADVKVEAGRSSASVGLQPGPSQLTQQHFGEKSSAVAACASLNSNPSCRGNVNGASIAANIYSHSKEAKCLVDGRGPGSPAEVCLYMGSSFKPQAYFNLYTHGDFAASAAASLAIISSEENRVPESLASSNPRKLMSIRYSLQMKAFSLSAKRFFWPNADKKLVEVPRERCGWCLSCKASNSSKRGCLLNAAASNAIRGAVKILASLRQLKYGEGCLAAISTYVMFMEESLRGLTVGPFLTPSYRTQWRKQLEQAANLSTIKTSLLELEKNIRIIAFSAEWVKLVDDTTVDTSVVQSAASVVGSTQKRGPGRRGRKPSSMSEVTDDDQDDISTGFVWWRGGMLCKHIFQRGMLPRPMIKKSARRGGSEKIPGIHYAEGVEVPKRSRQFVWRAAVEMSKNAAQLALQVRLLDIHVRWSDLSRPEQSLQEGKGPETEASAFRNASIVDKKSLENKISYGVSFENQKHLPSRVLKNILEVEQCEDGKEKHWFVETRIPLYLINEYEEKAKKVLLPSSNKLIEPLSRLQKRQLKDSRKDIFSYLSRKRDNKSTCSCASCQFDVFLGDAVKCSACEGYCHKQCIVRPKVLVREEVDCLVNCERCCNEKATTHSVTCNKSPISPLLLQGLAGGKQNGHAVMLKGGKQKIDAEAATIGRKQNVHAVMATPGGKQNSHYVTITKVGNQNGQAVTATKGGKQNGQKLLSSSAIEKSSDMKSAKKSSLPSTKSSKLSYGLIWKKKDAETGIDFRLKNVLFKDNPNGNLLAPECCLCLKPYDSSLMYIHCETCNKWYHADAVGLAESKVLELMGFKCCRCRRIRSPVCPYMDPETKKAIEEKHARARALKQTNMDMDPDSLAINEPKDCREPLATPVLATEEEIVSIEEDNPLLVSISTVDQITERNLELEFECNAAPVPGSVPQKLPVRRHLKSEKGVDDHPMNNMFEVSTPYEGGIFNPAEESSSPHVEWDMSVNGFEDGMMFDYDGLNYEDMEFEPQTYFSFKELLASDDGAQLDGVDPSGNVTVNWENSSAPLQDCNPEQYEMGISYDNQEPMFSVEAAVDTIPCSVCLQAEPSADLSCQICGVWMHSHCSPWNEEASWEGGWRCANCREWR